MLGLLVAMLIILSFSIFCATYFNKRVEETIIINIFSIIFILYVFGLLNILKYGCYFLTISSIILYFFSIVNIVKKKNLKATLKNIFTPAFLIWCIFVIFILYINFGRLYYNWDEFTHWGSAVYDMYYINALSNNPASLTNLPKYPPAITIFQYFFQFFHFTGYREWISYFAYQLIYISLFIPFLKNINWHIKDLWKIVISIIIIFTLPLIFYSNFYSSIYVDGILGLVFGYSLVSIWLFKKYELSFYINTFLSTFVLVLTKDAGLILALILVINLGLKILVAEEGYKDIIHFNLKKILKKFIPCLFILLVIIFSYFSWKNSFKEVSGVVLNVVDESKSFVSGFGNFINLLLGKDNTYLTQVLRKFIDVTFKEPNFFGKLSFFGLLIVILVLHKIFFAKIKDKRKVTNTFILSCVLGFILYAFFLLYTYCNFFTVDEALVLTSYSRYINTYLLGIVYSVIMFLLLDLKDKKMDIKIILILLTILYWKNPIYSYKSLMKKENLKQGLEYRNSWFTDYAQFIKSKLTDNNNRIYIISEGSNGIDYWILRYELRTCYNKISQSNYSIVSSEENKKDVYTNIVDYEKFKNELINEYDYLVLFSSNDTFVKDYGKLFENKKKIDSKQLYKIDKEKNKLILIN